MKPAQKILIDADILKGINDFYSAKLRDTVMETECFSDPKLDSHICNILVLSAGTDKCKYCGNVPGRLCRITCHIHQFCLAAYAYRLGIGVLERKPINKSLQKILNNYSYNELYDLVIKTRDSETVLEKMEEKVEEKMEDVKETVEDTIEKPAEKSDEKLLTLKAAADLYGCTYANMYGFVARGKLEKVLVNKSRFVREADVLKLKDKKRKSRKDSNKTEE